MIRIAAPLLCLALGAGACAPVTAPAPAATRSEFNTAGLGDADSRPDPSGGCVATEVRPAAYEQVPGQVQSVPAEIAADGRVIRPAIYRNTTVPKLVRLGEELSFPAPCPPVFTPAFIASLQRALAARGYFAAPVSGRMDAPTRAAIRAYQSERGLESDKLALATAREFGLVTVAQPEADSGTEKGRP